MRSGFIEAITELEYSLSESMESFSKAKDQLSIAQAEIKRLNNAVSNYEKIIAARDRFGCWLCAKHERESYQSEDDEDEKEALRNENLTLRAKIKRMEISIYEEANRNSRPTHLRSSMRTMGESRRDVRHIKFLSGSDVGRNSRASMGSSGRSSAGSVDQAPLRHRVSFDPLPVEEVTYEPLPIENQFPTGNTLSRTVSVPSGVRKTRDKQVLFTNQLKRTHSNPMSASPWAVKYSTIDEPCADIISRSESIESIISPADEPLTEGTQRISKTLSQIDVVKSLFSTTSIMDLDILAKSMTLVKVALGDTVSKQGDPGLFFMIVNSGEFVCESIGRPSRDLRSGDFFGEEIFIHPAPIASVSVTCTATGELWAIYTDALRKALRDISTRHIQVAKETLELLPKPIRDSMNSTQFNSICKSADIVTVTTGQQLNQAVTDRMLVVVAGSVMGGQVMGKGSIITGAGDEIFAGSDCVLLSIPRREIESIPPLAVAWQTLASSGIIPGVAIRLPTISSQSMDLSSPISDYGVSRNHGDPSPYSNHQHPLSPSLRPSLSEVDISSVTLFNLLSISARTHLMNRAKFLRISYDAADSCIVNLGIVLILNGTAIVRDPISLKSVCLDQGHSVGFGSGSIFSKGEIQVYGDSSFFDLDEQNPPPVIVAYWTEDVIRASLPPPLRVGQLSGGSCEDGLNEIEIVTFLKKRKLLLRNPVFQLLTESGLAGIIANSNQIDLDHNQSVLARLSGDECFMVFEGQVKLGSKMLSMGDFFNTEKILRNVDEGGIGGDNELLPSSPIMISAFSIVASIIVISRENFTKSFSTSTSPESAAIIRERMRSYLDELGSRIDFTDLRIGRIIGRGGTAVVKMASIAKDNENGPLYALKIIKKKLLQFHNKYHLLKNEKMILQSLTKSPFIVQLRQTFKDDRNLYFLLELAPGGDLLSVINNLGTLSRDQAQFYIGCMIEGLKFCHDHKIVYRDLKPENLLVDARGYVKLTDFGIAKKFSHKFFITYSLVGTPQFMAPEIITGHGYGFSVDVWSLGICLYELMIGELPFQTGVTAEVPAEESNNQFRLFQAIIHFDPNRDLQFPDFIDDVSRNFICQLLNPNPHLRVGCTVGVGINELKRNEFFGPTEDTVDAFEWDRLADQSVPAPYIPDISQMMLKRPLDGEEINMQPNSSPALSVASFSSFEPAQSVWSAARDTSTSWDFNF